MTNNYKDDLISEILSRKCGYRCTRRRDGLYKRISDDISIFFHVLGGYRYVELYYGIRSEKISRSLFMAASKCGWSENKKTIFSSQLIGLSYTKVGDFCSDISEVGITCPEGSKVLSFDELIDHLSLIESRCREIVENHDVLHFVLQNRSPASKYMTPAFKFALTASECKGGADDNWQSSFSDSVAFWTHYERIILN